MGLRAIKIDTLALAKELENAGVPRSQAEAQIQTTIKVVDMAIEEKLVTKHDLNHALHRTEEKFSAEISKTENKLMAEIDKLHRADEKLSDRIDKLDEKFSNSFGELQKNFYSLSERLTELCQKVDNLSSKITLRLGGIVTAGLFVLGAVLKFKV